MLQYVARRLLLMIPTMLGITFITFLIIRLAPGDPVSFQMGGGGDIGAEGGNDSSGDREKQILRAKIRLGLMQEHGAVRLWDAATGRDARLLRGHDREVRSVAFQPDGPGLLATASADATIMLWEPGSGRRVATLSGHQHGVNAIAFSRDGGTLASVSDDRSVRLWKLTPTGEFDGEGQLLGSHDKVASTVAYSPNGQLVASGSRDRSVRLWDVATGREVARLAGHRNEVLALAFTPDGSTLISSGRDRQVILWNVETRRESGRLEGHPAVAHSIAVSPDGERVAGGLGNNLVVIWSVQARSVEHTLRGHNGSVSAVAFSSDGSRLVTAGKDKSIRLWDVATATQRSVLAGHTSEVYTAAWSPDGTTLATGALGVSKVSIPVAYGQWLWRLARLDLGRSFTDDRPVRDKLAEALPITIKLNVIAIVLIYLISIPIGALAAVKRNGLFDQVSSVVLFVLYSMPSFWVATMLIILIGSPRGLTAQAFDWTLPFAGLHSDGATLMPYTEYVRDHVAHMILPVIALTYASFAFLSRLVRSSMLEVLGLDFVRTARAKGLPERDVIGKHALRNSLISVTTILGNVLPTLIGGSVIIEYIFSVPGMGALGFDAILRRDYPVIMAITTISALMTMLGILLSDILYGVVDPRIQLQ